jgi:diaminopimelate decarboxylase
MPALSFADARSLADQFGTPLYLYDEAALIAQANATLAFPNAFGLTVRYAVKACPNRAILALFDRMGLHFDASSGYEVHRLVLAGIAPTKISLSTQELPADFADLVRLGVAINACSLNQLERFGQALPGSPVGLRFNPGMGSGSTNRTNVGGPASSFGIWHEQIPQVKELLTRYRLTAVRAHTHIGSGSDPAVWLRVAELSLDTVRHFPSIQILNMGGGYKVARMPGEKSTNLQEVGAPVANLLQAFAAETGRQLHFEIEPGTYLLANCGDVLCRVQDVCDTGPTGHHFLKLDTGMTEVLRPSLYGAQHPVELITAEPRAASRDYVVVGHCCESGDILTPAPGQPEVLGPRSLPVAAIGDFCRIGGAGAYCSAMPAKNYNSFPEASEVLRCLDGSFRLIRRRQSLAQIVANELP